MSTHFPSACGGGDVEVLKLYMEDCANMGALYS